MTFPAVGVLIFQRYNLERSAALLDSLNLSDWLHQAGELALSREMLEGLLLRLALIAGIFALA